MRKMVQYQMIAVAGLLAMVFFVMLGPVRPQMWLYPLVRQATVAKINFETRTMTVRETPHFVIKYTAADAGIVDMVAVAAERAYEPVTRELGYVPPSKTTILIYPDKSELRKAFGWSGDESAMGVYWGGVIQLLSPRAWMQNGASLDEFIHSGPVAHEFTHLVFDLMTNGNYSRWFTEGLAQYTEYRVNHYEWITPANNLHGQLYTMAQLDDSFDDLSNQALAYRESLAAIRYITDNYGDDRLRQIIGELQHGVRLERAIPDALGMSYADYETAWQQWAIANMANAPAVLTAG